ncbi:MAG: lactonase family protein, partial [Planctomycetales bacterium]
MKIDRRWFLAVALGTVAVSLATPDRLHAQQSAGKSKAKTMWAYVGTYSRGESKGIYLYHLDMKSGRFTPAGLAAESANPSFVAIHPNGRLLYAVNETGDFGGEKSGAVSAFSVDQQTGKLTLLNQQPSQGAAPCHLVVDETGKHVLAANYTGGSVISLPIQEDGKLGKA